MDQPTDNCVNQLEQGRVVWPGAGRVHDCEVPEDSLVELVGGRRRFYVLDGEGEIGSPKVGDLVAFYVRGREWSVHLFVITLLWTHDGIMAGWQIASLRPVRLTLGE